MNMDGSTAARYKVIADHVSITFKQHGYRMRGTLFWKDKARVRILAELQKSRRSSAEQILFTINLSIVVKELLDPEFDSLERMRGYDGHLYWRVGDFLWPRADKWWLVDEATDPQSMAHEVGEVLLDFALPEIEKYSTESSIVELLNSEKYPPLSEKQRKDLIAKLLARSGTI